MNVVLYALAGVALLVAIARYVNRLQPEPEPIWLDGDSDLDARFVRDERLGDVR